MVPKTAHSWGDSCRIELNQSFAVWEVNIQLWRTKSCLLVVLRNIHLRASFLYWFFFFSVLMGNYIRALAFSYFCIIFQMRHQGVRQKSRICGLYSKLEEIFLLENQHFWWQAACSKFYLPDSVVRKVKVSWRDIKQWYWDGEDDTVETMQRNRLAEIPSTTTELRKLKNGVLLSREMKLLRLSLIVQLASGEIWDLNCLNSIMLWIVSINVTAIFTGIS